MEGTGKRRRGGAGAEFSPESYAKLEKNGEPPGGSPWSMTPYTPLRP